MSFGEWDWLPALDGDARALGLMKRHYSWREYKDGRPHRLFVGPGEKMVLLTQNCQALFVWRKFIDDSGEEGVNCAVFHNEGHPKASDLVRSACELAWQRWPGERLYTYVAPKKIRSPNPGYCFKKAGWRFLRRTKRNLDVLYINASTDADATAPAARRDFLSSQQPESKEQPIGNE